MSQNRSCVDEALNITIVYVFGWILFSLLPLMVPPIAKVIWQIYHGRIFKNITKFWFCLSFVVAILFIYGGDLSVIGGLIIIGNSLHMLISIIYSHSTGKPFNPWAARMENFVPQVMVVLLLLGGEIHRVYNLPAL